MRKMTKWFLFTLVMAGVACPAVFAKKPEWAGGSKAKIQAQAEAKKQGWQLHNPAKRDAKMQKKQIQAAFKTSKDAAMTKFKEAKKAAKALPAGERDTAMQKATQEKNAAIRAAEDAKKTAMKNLEAVQAEA